MIYSQHYFLCLWVRVSLNLMKVGNPGILKIVFEFFFLKYKIVIAAISIFPFLTVEQRKISHQSSSMITYSIITGGFSLIIRLFHIYRTRVPRQYTGSTIHHRNGIWLIKPLWFKNKYDKLSSFMVIKSQSNNINKIQTIQVKLNYIVVFYLFTLLWEIMIMQVDLNHFLSLKVDILVVIWNGTP